VNVTGGAAPAGAVEQRDTLSVTYPVSPHGLVRLLTDSLVQFQQGDETGGLVSLEAGLRYAKLLGGEVA